MRHFQILGVGRIAILIGLVAKCPAPAGRADGQTADAVRYTVTFPSPERHLAQVEAIFPTEKQASIELFMPVWSPGFYRGEDYAKNVEPLERRNRRTG